ncbi:MAG TPA: hemolysin family protein, partial [Treponemataceae bacterium]|nr:hemolysin family protein [Treponemataceae bacterium]
NALLIQNLKKNINKLLSTIAIGNNFVNAAATSIATALALYLVGSKGTFIATVIMTIAIILFGEILPKTMASYYPFQIAQISAPALHIIKTILYPLVWLFTKFSSAITFLFSITSHSAQNKITEDELKTLIDVGDKEGILEAGEKEMLGKIFKFSDLRTRDLQKHRSLVKSLPITATYDQTVTFISQFGFSRIPVYEHVPTNIVGLVHFKDILFYSGLTNEFSLELIMNSVLFVPETKPALDLLYFLKKNKQHFAVVVDEHGSNSGIVTMDDILKRIFGRITDEYNTRLIPAEDRISVISPREFVFPGDILLSDLNAFFSLSLESEDCITVGGWLIEQFGYLPEASEILRYKGLLLIVEDQSNLRIQSIRMIVTKDR